jgi:hypothetical protein
MFLYFSYKYDQNFLGTKRTTKNQKMKIQTENKQLKRENEMLNKRLEKVKRLIALKRLKKPNANTS